jgi:hypothetical protein
VRFHDSLARRADQEKQFHYHYVTAREMYNLVKAAEAGSTRTVADELDRVIPPPRPAAAVRH